MARLTTDQVRKIVRAALSKVADFEDGAVIDNFPFDKFNKFHMEVFCAELKRLINEEPYHADAGGTIDDRCYDITLNPDIIAKWITIGDCIRYIVEKQSSYKVPTRARITF